ncbi:magnesium transporter MgtE N-terminal domain-containing protein [Paenibacillus physcomitrellae]|uniref:Magnesium transporter MgtE intracellular domain-containing protein n=1 Tax=Paenibacillus physcomitrellae TaxID=1619311 RepID=A0ABQ1GA74_9BACL|nr:hypothetical protein [Paenibacillus physcomitrellae]GGA39745.1 hypothetical protein GCM10010917_26240 [Paenibacillus physcomitrellae]
MAQAELEEKETGGGFGRFLFFVTPILFTIVLLGVLLTLLNKDVQNKALTALNKVPFVNQWVPDPVKTGAEGQKDTAEQEKSSEATIKELKNQLAEQQKQIQKANEQTAQQSEKVNDLQAKLDEATQKNNEQAQQTANEAAENYQKQVKQLAQLYGEMNASKAASIMSNLTTEENVLLFNAMSNESKSAILEKMDPKEAAEISIRLKDAEPSEDLAIAALQSRLKKDESAGSQSTGSSAASGLDTTQLSQTFATMDPTKAAKLLLQTNTISPEKTLSILHAVDDATRSRILAAMSDEDDVATAKILNKLVSSK